MQPRGFAVSSLHMTPSEEYGNTYQKTMDKLMISHETKYTAPCEMVSDHLNAEETDMQAVITNVKKRLAEGTTGFYDALKKYQ